MHTHRHTQIYTYTQKHTHRHTHTNILTRTDMIGSERFDPNSIMLACRIVVCTHTLQYYRYTIV